MKNKLTFLIVSFGATLGSCCQAAEVPMIQSMADKWSEKAGLPIRVSHRFEMDDPEQLTISPGNHLAARPNLGKFIMIWDLKNGQPFRLEDKSFIATIAFSPITDTLAFGAGRHINIWDVQRKKITNKWKGHKAIVASLAFSPDGKLLASGSDTIKIWNAQKGSLTKRISTGEFVMCLAFSFFDQLIASGSDRDTSLKLWDMQTEKLKKSFYGHKDAIISVEFSPAGQIVASSSIEGTVKLWNLETEKLIKKIKGYHMAFSPDGTLLATTGQLISHYYAAEESSITLWDMRTFEKIRTIKTENSAQSLAFTHDGMQLAAVIQKSNKIVVWKLGN